MPLATDLNKIIENIVTIAYQAGTAILEIYNSDFSVTLKEDASPLTQADLVATDIICSALKRLTPHIPVVCEEIENDREDAAIFWLVDPLDGTKEFINRNNEFTVNIALIENNLPLLGVIYAPALDLLYGGIVGQEAFKVSSNRQRVFIQANPAKNLEMIVVCSRHHSDEEAIKEFLSSIATEKTSMTSIGSSLKFCKIAEGDAHIYPRFGRTMEWDTAAGQAILMAAGGYVSSLGGNVLTYGKKNFENPHFIASSFIFQQR